MCESYCNNDEEMLKASGTLYIGDVVCLECGDYWDALAYEEVLRILECPYCGACNSKPLGS